MTADLLILNKGVIALAAHNAIRSEDGKVYVGVEKIFELSDESPMGMMICGNSTIAGISLETLIKVYRRKADFEENDSVEKIMKDFISFAEEQVIVNGDDDLSYLDAGLNEFKNNLPKIFLGQESPIYLLEDLTSNIDLNLHDFLKENNLLEESSINFDDIINRFFTSENKEYVNSLLIKLYLSTISHPEIIIAGYNKGDLFPSFVSYNLYGFYEGKFLFNENQKFINSKEPKIIPLAQTEEMKNFFFGIDPVNLEYISEYVLKIVELYIHKCLDILSSNNFISPDKLSEAEAIFYDVLLNNDSNIADDVVEKLLTESIEKSSKEMVLSMDFLSENGIGDFCELLLNLASFKEKLSSNIFSVVGDIEVAVISKGNGFVWSKKKNSFYEELNY